MKLKYLEKPKVIPLNYVCDANSERTFEVSEDIEVELSDGRKLVIEKGFQTDLMSIPQFLWCFLKPFDKGLIGDLIHDKLWEAKKDELQNFNFNIYKTRKFADDERKKWRKAIVPEKKFKNLLTHLVIRLVGIFYYSKQIEIPK